MLIKAISKTGLGMQYALDGNNDLAVAKGVTVRSLDDTAVDVTGGRHDVVVAGTIIGGNAAIDLQAGGNGQTVSVLKGGQLIGINYAVLIGGLDSTFVNRGTVTSDAGVIFTGEGDGVARVSNFGSILSSGVTIGGMNDGQRSVIRNAGLIAAPDSDAVRGGQFRDVVINTGRIIGDIDLTGGNDRFEGRGGEVFGRVYGGAGNDVFIAGRAPEDLFGGSDTDRVDYRSSGAVKIVLDGSIPNGKAARNDILTGIEQVFGSAKGNDLIRGSDLSEDLRGFGGADTLKGGDGSDTLVGGAGKDVIDASDGPGIFSDHIIFNALAEGGDRIGGFSIFDEVEVKGSAFKGGLALGGLIEERFKTGGNNKAAEADDRFIFRTGDATLWFDRDGTGAAFKPVLLADFADGTGFGFNNITII
jgi:Ca2+-binding RTX toxin-like protein